MPKSPLKLVDTPAEYTYQRLADLANEVKRESDQTVSIATDTLEIARLQTEVADLRERCAELERELRNACHHRDTLAIEKAEVLARLHQAREWAKAWKKAARFNWVIHRATSIAFNKIKEEVNQLKGRLKVEVGEPCPTCGYFVPDGEGD
jgi:FtsZ-binding cell division protein ZapB